MAPACKRNKAGFVLSTLSPLIQSWNCKDVGGRFSWQTPNICHNKSKVSMCWFKCLQDKNPVYFQEIVYLCCTGNWLSTWSTSLFSSRTLFRNTLFRNTYWFRNFNIYRWPLNKEYSINARDKWFDFSDVLEQKELQLDKIDLLCAIPVGPKLEGSIVAVALGLMLFGVLNPPLWPL